MDIPKKSTLGATLSANVAVGKKLMESEAHSTGPLFAAAGNGTPTYSLALTFAKCAAPGRSYRSSLRGSALTASKLSGVAFSCVSRGCHSRIREMFAI